MNPYEDLPPKAFWKLAVASRSMFDINDIWNPKFHIKQDEPVVTFGSCFAQHIGQALSNRGFKWLFTEKPPHWLNEQNTKKFGYNIFSARTGNIYTTSLLHQWTKWALEIEPPPTEIWEGNSRFYDPFRPRIEPNGFASEEEVKLSREQTITSFKASITSCRYFVFTLGLTESWVNSKLDYEYPMCPGTVAGEYDQTKHKFINQKFTQIESKLNETIALMKSVNPKMKFILTVSPVPLTATMSGNHVAVATMASKSVLRTVAEQISSDNSHVDYFPSYEIINSPIFKGTFFEPNQRSVNPYGVNFVMDTFFKCLSNKYGSFKIAPHKGVSGDQICEEELLEAFGK